MYRATHQDAACDVTSSYEKNGSTAMGRGRLLAGVRPDLVGQFLEQGVELAVQVGEGPMLARQSIKALMSTSVAIQ
jgi:hypothetical protein